LNIGIQYLRGINHLNSEYFSLDWASTYDQYYLLPLAVSLINYLQISNSKHPYLLSINHKNNTLHRITFSFMTSLICLALPSSYLISYITFSTANLILTQIYHLIQKRKLKSILTHKEYKSVLTIYKAIHNKEERTNNKKWLDYKNIFVK
jgi:hypothetical protein